MRPYSNDLREHILAAVDRGEHTLRQIARLFGVSLSFLVRLLQQRRVTGRSQPRPHGGGRTPCLDAAAVERLLALVQQYPDATLAELRDRLGIPCHLSTVGRVLQRHRITRKKKTLHAEERDSPETRAQRVAFRRKLAAVDAHDLVFVDECGVNTALTRLYGRAPAGQRVVGVTPGQWQNVTAVMGLRLSGVVAPLAFVGATDGAVFGDYVHTVLAPALQPNDIVVWDNLAAHRNMAAVAAIEAARARLEPLPVYSPDLNPIEEMISQVKAKLRAAGARTFHTVVAALGTALEQITPQAILGWFHDRCWYAMQ